MDESQSRFGLSPPPRVGDILFGGDQKDWPLNACIMHYQDDADKAYRDGFRKAAVQLIEKVCERPVDQDTIVYPILYLYRHHIELILKSIFRLGSALLDKKIMKDDERHLGRHDLAHLWNMVTPMIAPICKKAGEADIPVEELNGVNSYILQISKHDPDGQRFRYGTTKPRKSKGTKKSERSLHKNLVLINIRTFGIHLEILANYLDGMEGWFAHLQQGRSI